MHSNRNLILTVAVNYDLNQIKLFINSILINCPQCDVLFFCDKSVKNIILNTYPTFEGRFLFSYLDFYTEYKIKKNAKLLHFLSKVISLLILINNFFALKKNNLKLNLDNLNLGKYIFINSHFLLRRFTWYSNINRKIKEKYDHIIISDCRDVIFQNDPIGFIKKKGDFIVSGYEPELIKDNKINKNWLIKTYKKNSEIYKTLINKNIICAGVTFGTRNMIFEYLERMRTEIINYVISNKKISVTNLDQCFHNKIFYYADSKEFILDKSNKLITTFGYTNKLKIKIDKESKKILVNEKIPSIIHQYDRDSLISHTLSTWFSNLSA